MPAFAFERFADRRPGLVGGVRCVRRRHHEIEGAGGAEGGIPVAPVSPPDAGAMHPYLAVDQSLRRGDAVDPRFPAVAGAKDHARPAKDARSAAASMAET